jgi:predicted nucleic acid-binding protein
VILLDTNILLRYAKPTDPAHPIIKAAIAALQAAGEDLCFVPQSVYEFWVVATRPVANNGLGLTVAESQQDIATMKKAFLLLPDQPGLFAEWESLVVAHDCKGKVAHDARLVAAMRTHGITRILTLNGVDFQRYPGITVLDPAAISAPTPTPPPPTPPNNP